MNTGAFGEGFPYVNFHDLNLDWILQMIKAFDRKLEKAMTSKLTVADPIDWSIGNQYEELTIVMYDGNAYISTKAVPYGVPISDTEYWQKIFDLGITFDTLKEAISTNDEGVSTIASEDRAVGDLVWLNEVLKRVTAPIAEGQNYSSSNTEDISIAELLGELIDTVNQKVQNRLWGKQIAIYGDSYSVAPRGTLWQSVLNNLTGTTCHVSAQGSLSLPQIYTLKWDSYNADIYIIEGGLNDVALNTGGNTFMTAIENFVSSIRSLNPNAEIYFVTPPDIYTNVIHNYVYPLEFYRQCIWHLAPKHKYGVIDGLKWQGLIKTDGVHPNDATAPLIGEYIFRSLLTFGDTVSFYNDYSKIGRTGNDLLLVVDNGTPYLVPQNLELTGFASDGSTQVNLSQLDVDMEQNCLQFTVKIDSSYYQAFMQTYGSSSADDKLLAAVEGATSADTRNVRQGFRIPMIPKKWQKRDS